MTVTSALPETLLPATTDAVREIVADAHRRAEPVRITGAGTWRDAGAPVHASRTLSLAALSGIIAYGRVVAGHRRAWAVAGARPRR
jgi:FAD/FMN-containing dehydrogenase